MVIKSVSRLQLSKLKLRAKVTLGVILPLVLILSVFTLIENSRHRALILNNLSLLAAHSGRVFESNLRDQMLKSDFAELQELLDSIGKTGSFRIVYLLDTSGKVIFAPQKQGVGLQLDNQQPDCQPCHRLPPDQRPESVVVKTSDGERVFRSMHLIENQPECSQCHDPKQKIIGLLLTDIPIAPMEAPLAAHLRENIMWWAGAILIVLLVANLVLSRFVLRPLNRLSKAITGLGEGQSHTPLAETPSDEIGQLSSAFNEMARQVETRSEENQALSESLQRQSNLRGELLLRLITAQEDERKRVARELHDELGQSLSGLAFKAGLIRSLIPSDQDRAENELDQTIELIHDTTQQMYELILDLRPSILDDMGLTAALRSHAERTLTGTGIEFDMDVSGLSNRLPPEMETTLYRVFQEALQNIIRYSKATQVRVKLSCVDGTFEGEICDNGEGFDLETVHTDGSKPRGLGLLGMQERIALVGGKLEVLTLPGCGTTLRIQGKLEERFHGEPNSHPHRG